MHLDTTLTGDHARQPKSGQRRIQRNEQDLLALRVENIAGAFSDRREVRLTAMSNGTCVDEEDMDVDREILATPYVSAQQVRVAGL